MTNVKLFHQFGNTSLWTFLKFAACFALLIALHTSIGTAQDVSEKSIPQLIEQLGDSNVNARRDAAYELVKRGDTSTAVIEAYTAATQDKDAQVQFQSFLGLAHAGPAAEPALSALLNRLDDRSDQIRFRAADAVGKIGSVALKPLLERWPDASTRFKISACQAFEIMGSVAQPAVPLLVEAVKSDQGRTREGEPEPDRGRPRGRGRERRPEPQLGAYAAAALVAIDPSDTKVLLTIAEQDDTVTRMIGISALAALPQPSPAVLDRLRKATSDEDPKIREISYVVLAKSKISTEEKETLLEAALVDLESSVRAAANVAMRRARLGGERFAERLAIRLHDADVDSAISVLEALSAVGPSARIGLPQIVASTRRLGIAEPSEDTDSVDSDSEQANSEDEAAAPPAGLPKDLVVRALAALGPQAVADLLEVVNAHPEMESVVAGALTQIGQPAIDALLAGTQDANPAIRIASVRALGDMQPLSERGLEQLVSAIGDENLEVRTTAASALTRAVSNNSSAQDAVLRAMEDDSPAVRAVAVSALGEEGFNRQQRRDGFHRALTDASAEVRAAALVAIAKTPGQMQRNASSILEQAAAAEENVRLAAVQALANVPKEVVDAGQFVSLEAVREAVVRALRDDSVPVRIAATGVVPKLELYHESTLVALGENLSGSRELIVATLEVLPKFQGDAEAIVARLQPLLTHELSEVRIAAVTAVAAADRDPLRLTQSLVPMLDDREWVVRRIAGQSLGRQGSVAVSAVPKLFELLGRHEDKDYSAESLRQIDTAPVEAVRLLIDNLDSEDRRKAFYAVTLLGKLGPAAAESVPILENLLEADSQGGTPLDDFRRNTIKEALERIKTTPTDL